MSKVNNSKAASKNKSTAMVPTRDDSEDERGETLSLTDRQRSAIQAMASRSFEELQRQAERADEERGTTGQGAGITEKDDLVGVPFLVVHAHIRPGNFKQNFATVTAIVQGQDEPIKFHASGERSGIVDQLYGILEKGDISPEKPHFVSKGLKRNDYVHKESGKNATTYYFDYLTKKEKEGAASGRPLRRVAS